MTKKKVTHSVVGLVVPQGSGLIGGPLVRTVLIYY